MKTITTNVQRRRYSLVHAVLAAAERERQEAQKREEAQKEEAAA